MTVTSAEPASRVEMPVLGMHCAACATRIEGALKLTPGVSRASVNYATGRATVEYDPGATAPADLLGVVRDVGYDGVLPTAEDAGGGESAAEVAARDGDFRRTPGRVECWDGPCDFPGRRP